MPRMVCYDEAKFSIHEIEDDTMMEAEHWQSVRELKHGMIELTT